MIGNAIFDLDLTLVNTTILESYRRSRDWQNVYNSIGKCFLYEGVSSVFQFIRQKNIKVCIVSTAPGTYIKKVVGYFHIPCDYIVGYHDAAPIKPAAAPMIKALQLLECEPADAVSFGDRAIDIQSSQKAGIKAIACTWGTKEKELLLNSGPDVVINSPVEIIEILK